MARLSSELDITLTDEQLVTLAHSDIERFKVVYRMGLDMMKLTLKYQVDPAQALEAYHALVEPHVNIASYGADVTIRQALQDEAFARSYLPRFHPLHNGSLHEDPDKLRRALWIVENVNGIDELLEQYNEQRVKVLNADPSGAFHIDNRTFITMLSANQALRRWHESDREVRFDLTLGFFHVAGTGTPEAMDDLMGRPFDRVAGIYYGAPFPDHKYTPTTREVEQRMEEES